MLFGVVAQASSAYEHLPRLHVTTLVETVDRRRTTVGASIHLTIHVHVSERVQSLDSNVVLPLLTDFTTLGDERRTVPVANGTDYVETVTISPLHTGSLKIDPAHLDAIDARTGLPTRFSSDPVVVQVAAADYGASESIAESMMTLVRRIVGVMLLLLAAGVVLFAFAVWRRRRPAPISPPNEITMPPPAPRAVDPRAALGKAYERLRAAPARAAVLDVRTALRACAGAGDDETLSDVLARLRDGEGGVLTRALRAVERAAFIEDARLQTAIDDALAAVERYRK